MSEGSTADTATSFRVPAASRWIHAATLVVLAGMTAGMVSATPLSWLTAVFVLLVVVQVVNTVQLWRWRVITDEQGVSIRQGLGPPRHVPWDDVRTVRRTLPPVIEVAGADDVRLGTGISRRVLQRTAEHIGERSARHRPAP